MRLLSQKGSAATGFVIVMGVLLAIASGSSAMYFRSQANSLVRDLNGKEGFYSSEVAAMHAVATKQSQSERPLTITNPSEWGIRRYSANSLKTTKVDLNYCGVTQSGSQSKKACVRDLTSTSDPLQCFPFSSENKVDFEMYSNKRQPNELDAISDEFNSTYGVTFCAASPQQSVTSLNDLCLLDEVRQVVKPKVVKVGAPQHAFSGYKNSPDTPDPSMHVGDYFLTVKGRYGNSQSAILIRYETPVAEASGAVIVPNLPIGSPGRYRIEAIGSNGKMGGGSAGNISNLPIEKFAGSIIDVLYNVVAESLQYWSGGNLPRYSTAMKPGSVVRWGFKHSSSDIYAVRISGVNDEYLTAIDNVSGSKCRKVDPCPGTQSYSLALTKTPQMFPVLSGRLPAGYKLFASGILGPGSVVWDQCRDASVSMIQISDANGASLLQTTLKALERGVEIPTGAFTVGGNLTPKGGQVCHFTLSIKPPCAP